jgi:hypothetical protein
VFGVHPDLRKQILVTSVSSTALGVAGLAALIVAWRSPSEPRWPLLLFAAASIPIAYIGLVIAPRWYRRASRVVASVRPTRTAIVLRLEADSDSTSLYASFATPPATAEVEPEAFPLVIPRWRVDLLLGTSIEADVYCDPSSQRPVAFRVPSGLLWCLPYARAV